MRVGKKVWFLIGDYLIPTFRIDVSAKTNRPKSV
jgi:hypothetical protein